MSESRHLPLRCIVGFLVTMTTIIYVTADDQFICCMKGIKRIRGVVLCPAPCCPGYEEMGVYASKLAKITYCQKKPQQLPLNEIGLYNMGAAGTMAKHYAREAGSP